MGQDLGRKSYDWGLSHNVEDLEFRIRDVSTGLQDLGSRHSVVRFQNSGFRTYDLGFRM